MMGDSRYYMKDKYNGEIFECDRLADRCSRKPMSAQDRL